MPVYASILIVYHYNRTFLEQQNPSNWNYIHLYKKNKQKNAWQHFIILLWVKALLLNLAFSVLSIFGSPMRILAAKSKFTTLGWKQWRKDK